MRYNLHIAKLSLIKLMITHSQVTLQHIKKDVSKEFTHAHWSAHPSAPYFQTTGFPVPVILCFLKYHVSEVIQYVDT